MKLVFEKKGGKLAWFAWIAAVVFYLYEYLVRVAPSVMESELAKQFSASAATMGMGVATYYFIYAPLQLFAGIMFDKFGGRTILVPASIIVVVGCLVPIIPSNSLICVAAGRTLAGIGSSFAFIGVMYLASVWFYDHRLAFLSGLATSFGIFGALLGQRPLSFFVDHIGWKMSFVLMAIVGVIVTMLLSSHIPDTPHWELEKRAAISDAPSIKNFLSGLISVCKNRQTWIIGAVGACLYAPLVIFGDLWGVRYVETSFAASKAKAAEAVAMLYIGWLVGGPLVGLLSDIVKCRRKLLIGGCFLSTILFAAALLLPIKTIFTFGVFLFLAGVCSSPEVICFVASLESNAAEAKGSAVAVVNMIVMLVGGLFQPIVGWLMELNFSHTAHGVSHEAFRNALLTMPILTFVGMMLALSIKREAGEGKFIGV
ncbi:MAG: MFS transporter [Puniceicoccales bacterium]|jgi:MFS family permease|nr:MFS transporter [Puniceicoccales bacterium]